MLNEPVATKNQQPRWMIHLAVIVLTAVLLLVGMTLLLPQHALAGDVAQEQPPVSWNKTARAIGPQQPADLQWYSAQLHIHAWSNHNAGLQPGSLELHSQWAQGANLDVIWWQEHNPTFYQVADYPISLASATIQTDTLNVSIPLPPNTPVWAVNNYVGLLQASVTGGGQADASLGEGILQMQVQSDSNQIADRFQYEARTAGGFKLASLSLTRPLASDPLLSFDVARCDASGSLAYGEVKVGLSWHNYGTAAAQQLVYRMVPADQPANIIHSATTVTVTVPLTATRVNLPVLRHASLLQDGDDNSIQGLILAVGARQQATGCMQIGNFSVHSRVSTSAELVQKHQEIAHQHAATYGVQQITSWEQFSGIRHLNPFLPADASLLPDDTNIQVQNYVPLVHSHNGLVGLNHPFGASSGAFLPVAEQEALLQGLLDTMLPVQGWDLDLIEIYKSRAQIDLYHHMRLWDLLAANGVELCANMASDQHGGMFYNVAYMV